MTDSPLTPQDDEDALAAEYVLGVQRLTDRLATETRINRDPAFAARVQDWENRFAGLNDEFIPTPPPDLLPRIEARLFGSAQRRGWRAWLFGAATALALALVAMLLVPPGPPRLVSVLTSDMFQYEARFADERLTVTRVSGRPLPAEHSLQLWLIPPEQAPVPLGLLTGAEFTMPHSPPPPGWVLAISLEPLGGSPTGAPTGPVLAAAPITPP